jgi:hypothetical protein
MLDAYTNFNPHYRPYLERASRLRAAAFRSAFARLLRLLALPGRWLFKCARRQRRSVSGRSQSAGAQAGIVFASYWHRSAMRQRQHSGRRALHT